MSDSIALDTLVLDDRRRKLIAALRSGEHKQGNGQLFRAEMGYQSEIRKTWCCIGVGCKVSDYSLAIQAENNAFINLDEGGEDWDDELGYRHFAEYYDFPYSKYLYLAAMNDNSMVFKLDRERNDLIYTFGSFSDDSGTRTVRSNAAPKRDFTFIARFLEILWRLTP